MSTKDNTTNISPATKLINITKSDSTEYSPYIRAIYVGGSGDISVVDAEGNTVLFSSVPVGTHLGPFSVSRVRSTDTTATLLVGYV